MKRNFLGKLAGFLAFALAIAFVGGVLWLCAFSNSTEFVALDNSKLNNICPTFCVVDCNGQKLDDIVVVNNSKQIELEQLNPYTYNAFVAVEDKRYFKHNGVDAIRIVGATLHNLKKGGLSEGASTITQQLVKNTHLTNQKTAKRKINEALVALQLEKHYTKEQILQMYLNTIYFGRNAYGIENASNVYFDKSAKDLTLSESAILAGMIKAPNVYAPDKNAEKCKNRRDVVLRLMLEQGTIDQEQYQCALNEQISYKKHIVLNETTYLQKVVEEACQILNMTPTQLYNSGLEIRTYCNNELQRKLTALCYADQTLDQNGKLADLTVIVTNNKAGVCAYYARGQSSQTAKQIGSTAKPFAVYAPAIEEKLIFQASPVLDEQTDFGGYSPSNYGKYHGWTTVKEALVQSMNVPAVKTLNTLGLANAEKYLNKMGIGGKQNLTLALGNVEGGMTAEKLVGVYATFCNNGQYNQTAFVKSISTADGKVIYQHKEQNKQIFSAKTAFLTTDMLLDVTNRGTGKNLHVDGQQIACKTGTVGNQQGNSQALVVGYTTQNTVLAWYSGQLCQNTTGSKEPCFLAKNIFQTIGKTKDFEQPNGIVQRNVDETALKQNQTIYFVEQGARYLFDKNNLPKQQTKQTHNYQLKYLQMGKTVTLTLPNVQGYWAIFKLTNGTEQQIAWKENVVTDQIDKPTTYYAKLYQNNNVVYTTPKVQINPEKTGILDWWYLK